MSGQENDERDESAVDVSRRRLIAASGLAAVSLGTAGCSDVMDSVQSGDDADTGTEDESDSDATDLESIGIGETAEGFVDKDDESDPEYDDLAEPVTLSPDEGRWVEITMESDDIEPYLLVEEPNGDVLTEDGDGPDDTSSIQTWVTGGQEYTVWAGSASGDATGSYTLSVEGGSSDSDDLRSIDVGETTQGRIDDSDPRDPERDKLSEPVALQVEEGTRVDISMTSEELDTYLILTGPDGDFVAEDDDGGDGLNSRMTTTLSQGTYTIWAATFGGDSTGSYTLSVEEVSSSGDDLGSISIGETATGYIDRADGRDPAYDKLAEPVALQGRADTSVRISMQSDEVDTYLVLEGPGGEVVAEDDDGGSGLNSRLETTLSGGTYTIWAATYGGESTGSYTLSVEEITDVESGADLESISIGETAQGYIDDFDGRDPAYNKLGEPVELEGAMNVDVTISMQSEEVDTYLVLEGPGGEVVAEDDDGGSGLNSRLDYTLSRGTYTIWATTYGGDSTGSYTLSVEGN